MMQSRRSAYVAVLVALAAGLAIVYFYVDPMEARWMPKCIWKVATGTDCPGCGSQRMAHALTHGDLAGAWRANAYALCMLPAMGWLLWLELARERHPQLYRKVHAPWVMWAFGVSVVIWWIVRNIG